MIPRDVAAVFPASVRSRGEHYFLQGRVRFLRTDQFEINAVVKGSAPYLVRIVAEKNVLTASCACPFANDHGICKHIWATLRAADQGQQLQALSRTSGKNPGFVALSDDMEGPAFDALFAESDLLGPDADVDLDADVDPPIRHNWSPPHRTDSHRAPPHPRHSHGSRPQPPVWKTLIDRAANEMAQPHGEAEPPHQAWPTDRRLVYVVDLAKTWVSQGIVVELATERRKDDGTWDAPAQFKLSTAVWQTSPDPLDRQIAQMLIGAPQPSAFVAPPRPGPFVLAGPSVSAVLPLICATGRCRVRQETGERPTDPIAFDDGPAWKFALRMLPQPMGQIAVTGVLKRPNEEMPISEPTAVHRAGVVFARGMFARLDHGGAFALVSIFREKPTLDVSSVDFSRKIETSANAPPSSKRANMPRANTTPAR